MEFKNQYLTYAEYKQLEGKLQEVPFNILELEARQNINKYTFNRLVDLQEQKQETKICMFKLIGILDSYNKMEQQNKSISSTSTDGYSESYRQVDESVLKGKENEIKGIIYSNLSGLNTDNGIPYLFRGV